MKWLLSSNDLQDQAKVLEGLRFALESAGMGPWSWDAATDMMTLSERAAEIVGVPPGPVMTWAAMQQMIHPEDRGLARDEVLRVLKEHTEYDIDYRILRKNGKVRWVFVKGRGIYDAAGQATGMVGVLQDVTSRKITVRRDAFLVQLDDATRPLTDPQEITEKAAQLLGEYLEANRCAYADVEEDQDTFNLTGNYNRGVPSIVGRYTFTQFGAECLRLMRLGQPYVVEDSETDVRTEAVRESYRMTQIRSVICVSLLKQGRFVAAIAVHQITPRRWRSDEIELVQQVANRCWESIERARIGRELREREGRLRRSEAQFRQLAENSPDIIARLDSELRLLYVNPAIERMTGRAAAAFVGQPIASLGLSSELSQLWADRCRDVFITKQTATFESDIEGSEGKRHLLSRLVPERSVSGSVENVLIIATDITQRKMVEEELDRRVQERTQQLHLKEQELAQAQKLEAIGRLAGGVAHDFNNLLTGILGIAEEMRGTLTDNDERRDDLNEIIKASNRAFTLTRQLLAFGRRQIIQPKLIDLSLIVLEVNKLLQRLIGEDVHLVLELEETKPIFMDPGHIEQIILNLTINARDAMPRGGAITIRTRPVVLQETTQRMLSAPPGDYVLLEVSDTGVGMDDSTRRKIFEPFFTTKPQGKGTGLGLATVYGIVQQAKGDIAVETQLGKGTIFRIYLPVSAKVSQEPTSERRPVPAGASQETVLVIEDEGIVRRILMRKLKGAGYTVYEAASGKEAVALLKGMKQLDLVVSDVVMPGMSGKEAVEQIKRVFPSVVVLFTSGYPEDVISHHGVLEKDIAFLDKTAVTSSLLPKVREILDNRKRT